ncbi:hypothetical protein O0L34_g6498 [Tuta absoluta]|nr:hypothetical protein O0L34_g6498 [Tuta absoluta]
MSEQAELLLALYDSQHNKLTEHLLLRWPPHNVSPAQVVFTDLGGDIKREKLFLVCHVVRIGSMEATNSDYRRSSIAPLVVASPVAASVGIMRRPFGVACADITRHLQVAGFIIILNRFVLG